MQNFLEIYPLIILTIYFFLSGFFIGNIINKYLFFKDDKYDKNLNCVLLNIIWILCVLVISTLSYTKFSKIVFKDMIQFKEEYVDLSFRSIFAFALMQSQTKLKHYMEILNKKVR